MQPADSTKADDMISSPQTILVIAGPTAVGKTDVAIRIAVKIDAEIISADSRQVFRSLRIGSAIPGESDLRSAPHHFIAERELSDPFSAGIFAREAEDRIKDIAGHGKKVIVVGGSTLYLKALTEGLAEVPDVRPGIRESLNWRLKSEGADTLFEELKKVDPSLAMTMDSTKSQRIIRGLEVWYETGNPLSEYFAQKPKPCYNYTFIILNRPRIELYERIDKRVIEMVDSGLIEEVQKILDSGIDPQINALRTIGYREVIDFLNGDVSKENMVACMQRNTRRYAKRQLTWFRGLADAQWLDMSAQRIEEVINAALEHLRLRGSK